MRVPIEGWSTPAFAPVAAAFEANFVERGEVGAAVCVMVAGEVAVDLVGGWSDEQRTRPWRHETIVDIYPPAKRCSRCSHCSSSMTGT